MTDTGSGGNRRLATILFADVAGYSRLVRADEEGTLTDLRAHLSELVAPVVDRFHGRIVKSLGDGVLIEFGSAVEAVRCAVELQRGMAERNAGLPADRRQSFRIGLHLGDIIVSDHDVFGDTVNVASRLQALAEPGAVVLSASVHEQVRDKIALAFRDLGPRPLKNIDRPMRAYALVGVGPSGAGRRRWVMAAIAGALFALVVAGGVFFYLNRGDTVGSRTVASVDPKSALSVAVLLFTNQSGDASQDYFADGLTEDITRSLGRFRQLTVIAYRAVLPWRGKELPPMDMGRALGARYLVSGSVRRIGDKVRVTVQLTDAGNGTQLWAELYDDKRLTNIFEVQDDISRKVAGSLASNLQQIALQQSLRKPTGNLGAYDLLLRARAQANESTRAGNRMARDALEKVVAMSPNYADAQAELAEANFQRAVYGWSEFADQDVEKAIRLAQKALELDDENVLAHSVLARAYTVQQRYDLGLAESERALQLNPSDAEALTARAAVLLWTGDIAGSIAAGELAMRLNSNVGPEPALNLGIAYLLSKRFADAVKLLEAARVRYPGYPTLDFPLAGAYAELGRDAEASDALEQGKKKDPYLDLAGFGTRFKDPALKRQLDETLRKAGLN